MYELVHRQHFASSYSKYLIRNTKLLKKNRDLDAIGSLGSVEVDV